MVHADFHKQNVGRFLLAERLKQIYTDEGEVLIKIDTSQHSKGFFEKFGFEATNLIENYYAPGIDRVDMVLHLTKAGHSIFAEETQK